MRVSESAGWPTDHTKTTEQYVNKCIEQVKTKKGPLPSSGAFWVINSEQVSYSTN